MASSWTCRCPAPSIGSSTHSLWPWMTWPGCSPPSPGDWGTCLSTTGMWRKTSVRPSRWVAPKDLNDLISSGWLKLFTYCIVESQKGVITVQMFCWEPEGRYRYNNSMAMAPFWFSMEHLWTAIMPYEVLSCALLELLTYLYFFHSVWIYHRIFLLDVL